MDATGETGPAAEQSKQSFMQGELTPASSSSSSSSSSFSKKRGGAAGGEMSKLQKRAPRSLSLKIVAATPDALGFCSKGSRTPIPLLSPLLLSPAHDNNNDDYWMPTPNPPTPPPVTEAEKSKASSNAKSGGWQHPAAPFYTDSRKCVDLLQP